MRCYKFLILAFYINGLSISLQLLNSNCSICRQHKKVTRWFLVFCVGDRLLYWKFDYSGGDEFVYPFLPDSKKRRCERYHWPLEIIERCKKQQTGIYPIEHKRFTLETCCKLITKINILPIVFISNFAIGFSTTHFFINVLH